MQPNSPDFAARRRLLGRVALAACLAVLLAGPAEAITGKVKVEALIDAESRLFLRGSTVKWFHEDGAAPGLHEGADVPTVIEVTIDGMTNRYEWFPEWLTPRAD